MQSTSEILLTLGGILLLGLATDRLGRRTFLPRVTLLLVFGIAIGSEVLNLIPRVVTGYFELNRWHLYSVQNGWENTVRLHLLLVQQRQ
jgi:NhaP-type Na+/H+ or K+/H+ antiporter